MNGRISPTPRRLLVNASIASWPTEKTEDAMKRLFMNRPITREVLDCGSPLPLWNADWETKAAEGCRTPRRWRVSPAAFSLTELLVVIAVLALLAATQLPALSRAKAPVKFTQCMNNCRQIAQATLLYKDNNNDAFPYSWYTEGGANDMNNPNCWPRQVLPYLGVSYKTNVQPDIFLCPSEVGPTAVPPVVLHYMANRNIMSDAMDPTRNGAAVRGAEIRKPSIYWMLLEKDSGGLYAVRPLTLNSLRMGWNEAPGYPSYRRHSGGTTATAADGHADWLRMPPYRPNAPAPLNFLELGDCSTGINLSTWQDPTIPGDHNGGRVKLWSRLNLQGFQ
jgi:prepilin-type N-terminal cleavage/methylation domain-containing protein